MTTLERPREDMLAMSPEAPAPIRRSRTWLLVAIVAILALVIGGAVGWFLNSEDDPRIVLAGSGELTERQLEMLDFMDDYVDTWHLGDGDALAAMYTPTGRFVSLGTTYRVADGSLAELVDSDDWSSLVSYEPVLVRGSEILSFHSFPAGVYKNSLQFTAQGELLLINHTVTT